MRTQLAAVTLTVLLFTGFGSAAFLSKALAQPNAHAKIQHTKRVGPKPTPHWYWRWVSWRLGAGYAKHHALRPSLRPHRAPRHVPTWAWRRLRLFLTSRKLTRAHSKGQHGSHSTSTSATTTTSTTTAGSSGWTTVVDDQFNSGGIPGHWTLYHSPYGSWPNNCTAPSHDYVANGYLNIVESWEPSTPAGSTCPYGAGWYTGGMKLDPVAPFIGNDQQVTVRYRLVSTGGVVSHHIIPMRWPTGITYKYLMNNGEEDFLETDLLSAGHTFLHYVDSGVGERVASPSYGIDLSQWHTVRVTQLAHTVYVYVDDMNTPVWTYSGDSTTIPDVLRTTVLQQECSHASGCPTGTTGSEDIQIDWITVENAS